MWCWRTTATLPQWVRQFLPNSKCVHCDTSSLKSFLSLALAFEWRNFNPFWVLGTILCPCLQNRRSTRVGHCETSESRCSLSLSCKGPEAQMSGLDFRDVFCSNIQRLPFPMGRVSSCQARHDLQVGKRRRAMSGEGEKTQTRWNTMWNTKTQAKRSQWK